MAELPVDILPARVAGNARSNKIGERVRRVFWPVAIAALIVMASSRSRVASPNITSVDDKFAHFAVYGLLATLVCRLGRGWRGAAIALAVVSAFGAVDEWRQSFVPGRYPSVDDWIADTLGAAVAVTAYTGWRYYRQLLERPLWRSPAD